MTPLRGMTELVELGLADNFLTDAQALEGLDHLEVLFLGGNISLREPSLDPDHVEAITDFRGPRWRDRAVG